MNQLNIYYNFNQCNYNNLFWIKMELANMASAWNKQTVKCLCLAIVKLVLRC